MTTPELLEIPQFLGRKTYTDDQSLRDWMVEYISKARTLKEMWEANDDFDDQFPGLRQAVHNAYNDLVDKVYGNTPPVPGGITDEVLEVVNGRAQMFWQNHQSDAFPILPPTHREPRMSWEEWQDFCTSGD